MNRDLPISWLNTLLFFPAYVAVFWLSDVFHLAETGSTPWNPEAGLAVLFTLHARWRAGPILCAAHLACLALWAPISTPAWTVVFALVHVASLVATTEYLRDHILALRTPSIQSSVKFVLAALIITAATTLTRSTLASFVTDWSTARLLQLTSTVATGNMIGIITVVPLLTDWPGLKMQRTLLQEWDWASSALTATLVVLCIVIFSNDSTNQFKYFYVVFLPVIAFAIRHGFMGVGVSTMVASLCMIGLLLVRDTNSEEVAELQVLMIILVLTGLFLGTTVTERQAEFQERIRLHRRWQVSQEALGRASRLSLASELAAAVSHEIVQPLAAARNHLRTTLRSIDGKKRLTDKVISNLGLAVTQIDRAAKIIRETRRHLKKDDRENIRAGINGVITLSCDLMAPDLESAGIKLHVNVPPSLPEVLVNRTQISQVIMNLLRNARDSLAELNVSDKTITVTASAVDRPGYVTIAISDNGSGVDQSVLNTLFEPLVSTRESGIGIGLSLCDTIVREHGGSIWHDTSLVDGARFVFTIPEAK